MRGRPTWEAQLPVLLLDAEHHNRNPVIPPILRALNRPSSLPAVEALEQRVDVRKYHADRCRASS